jgi:hypothetical protein
VGEVRADPQHGQGSRMRSMRGERVSKYVRVR